MKIHNIYTKTVTSNGLGKIVEQSNYGSSIPVVEESTNKKTAACLNTRLENHIKQMKDYGLI